MKTRGTPVLALWALALLLPCFGHALAPSITAIRRQNPDNERTSANRLVYQVIFNENVRDVDAGDFGLHATGTATGNVASVSAASGRVFYVTVTNVTGQGSLRLDVRPNGVGIAGSNGVLLDSVTSGQTYTLTAPPALFRWGNDPEGILSGGAQYSSALPVAVGMTGSLAGRNLVAVAPGDWHSLALTADGQVLSAGLNTSGQLGNGSTAPSSRPTPIVPGALAGQAVVAIAAGQKHNLALTADGKVCSWGNNSHGELGNGSLVSSPVPVAVRDTGGLAGKSVVAIAAGMWNSYALTADGLIYAWGEGPALGDGTNGRATEPVVVGNQGALAGTTFTAISAGAYFALALTADGQVYSWGDSQVGRLGIGEPPGPVSTPVLAPTPVDTSGVLAGKTVTAICAGGTHSLVMTSDGRLYGWGSLSQEGPKTRPVAVSLGTPLDGQAITSFAAYDSHSLALTADGVLYSWGANFVGQLGNGADSFNPVPRPVNTAGVLQGKTVTTLGPGCDGISSWVLAVDTRSRAAITGVRAPDPGGYVAGQILEFNVGYDTPVEVSGPRPSLRLSGFTNDRADTREAFFLTGSGGTNLVFRYILSPADRAPNGLGIPFPSIFLNGGSIRDFGGRNATLNFVAPNLSGIVVSPPPVRGGAMLGWGYNGQGQLGNNTRADSSRPLTVDPGEVLANFPLAGVAAGPTHSLALTAEGRIWAWGANASGQLGNNTFTDSTAPVAVSTNGAAGRVKFKALALGYAHSLALTTEGQIWAWGYNGQGQLGIDTALEKPSPTAVVTSGALAGRTITAIAGGATHSLALTDDGKVYAWGDNSYGQLGAGDRGNSRVPIAVDTSGVLAGKRVIAISAGIYHSLALTEDHIMVAWGGNIFGQLGNNNGSDSATPVAVSAGAIPVGEVIASLHAGDLHSLAVSAAGRLYAWGNGEYGQLGNGSTNSSRAPVAVEMSGTLAGKNLAGVVAGGGHNVVLTTDGQLLAWGYNDHGELGNGATEINALPGPVDGQGVLAGRKIRALASGSAAHHSLLLAAVEEAPAITSVKPPEARIWRAGENLKFDLTFSAPVLLDTRRGNPSLRLVIGTETRDATNVFGAGSETLTFSYTLQPNDQALDSVQVISPLALNGGLIYGLAGTSARLEFNPPNTRGLIVDSGVFVKMFLRTSGAANLDTVAWHVVFSQPISGLSAQNFNLVVDPVADASLMGPRVITAATPSGPAPTVAWIVTASVGTNGAGLTRLDMVNSQNLSRQVTPLPVKGPVYTNDLAAPETTLISAPPALSTSQIARFEIAGADIGFGVLHTEYVLDGVKSVTSTNRLVFEALAPGTHTLEASTVDRAGNVDPTPVRHTWRIDLAPPPKVLAIQRQNPRDAVTIATRLVFQVIFNQAVHGVAKEAFELASTGATSGTIESVSAASGVVFYVTVNRAGASGTLRLDLKSNRTEILGQSGQSLTGGYVTGQAYTVVKSLALVGWGGNSDRQLGFAPLNALNPLPLVLDEEGFFKANPLVVMAAGFANSLFLTAQGKVYGWGDNRYGELGNGTRQPSVTPVWASGELAGKTVVAIAAGYHHNLALTAEGGVYAWGQNDLGQASPPSPSPVTTPTRLDRPDLLGGVPAIAIAAGVAQSLALDVQGRIFSWGGSGAAPAGQHGREVPPGAMAGKTIIGIAAGADHNLALGSDGAIYGWGFNDSGELGRQTGLITQPVEVAKPADFGGRRVVAISAGWDHSLALTEDGVVFAWGLNLQGQLGTTFQGNSAVPLSSAFGKLKPVAAVYATFWHSHALASDGTLTGWGDNAAGVLGNGNTENTRQPVPVNFSGVLTGKRVAAFAGGPVALHSLALVFDPADLVPPVEPPVFAGQPRGVSAVLGDTVTLIAKATGAEPLAYQWFKTGRPVAGATNASLTLARVHAGDGGGYRLFVSNRLGTATSQEAEVVVFDAHGIAAKVATIAGNGFAGFTEGSGTNAQFNGPNGGYVDAEGHMYIADVNNHRVRRVSPSGDVVSMAGDGTAGYRDGPGDQARFNFPIGVFVDQGGDIYVADAENNRIRKISPAGFRNVSTVAGRGTPGYANGPALDARLNFPNDLVVNTAGDIFVTEFNNHTVRRITPGGEVVTWAGNGAAGYADGPPGQSRLNRPGGIAIDRAGNLYVTEWGNHRVRRIDPAGNVITLAGSGIAGYADGPALQARFNAPDGIAVDTYGNVYVTESANFVVRRIANGEVVTVAGGTEGGYRDGYATAARFGGGGNGPGGLGIDPQGNLLVADSTSQMIRKISLVVTPHLALTPGDNGLELSWPATSDGFVLESAARLEPPATWSVIPFGLPAPGATITVLLPWENVQRYYRLRRP